MNASEIAADIKSYCIANQNDELVRKYSRYFKDGCYDAWGLDHDQIYLKLNEILADISLSFKTAVAAGKILLHSGKYEEVFFAILIFKYFYSEYDKTTLAKIADIYDLGVRNWAHSDHICGELFRPMLKDKIIQYTDLEPWLTAENKFRRRSVPVACINLLKTTKDYQPLLNFIEPLMQDSEREVHQGVGWFLREAWKLKPNQVEPFLIKYKNTAPRLIFQYATEKMTKEQKELYRKEKTTKNK